MKLPLALFAVGALAACNSKPEQSVENQFRQTENAIENTAATLEAETDNATRAAASALENQANEVENRAEAVERAATTPTNKTGNGQ
jgi:hypothetical protein